MSFPNVKKFISFSLYGKEEKYNFGIIKNCNERNNIYPEFNFLIYYDWTVPHQTIERLKQFSFVHLISKSAGYPNPNPKDKAIEEKSPLKTLWRFEEFFSPEPKIILSRDADSLINIKERLAVEEWISLSGYSNNSQCSSNFSFHIMRDHPWHVSKIMAGMCGLYVPEGKANDLMQVKPIYNLIISDKKQKKWGVDQVFLNNNVYPIIINKSVKHCSHNRYEKDCLQFPKSDYNDFVGNYI